MSLGRVAADDEFLERLLISKDLHYHRESCPLAFFGHAQCETYVTTFHYHMHFINCLLPIAPLLYKSLFYTDH